MKKTITTILMLFTISIGANAQIALGNGLSACYPFTGNANDVSGNNYNGTVVGATLIPDRYGSANCAYNFNGNAYINLSDILNNVWVGSGNKFSISVWVKPNATLTNNIIIGKSGDLACSENQRQFALRLYTGSAVMFSQSNSLTAATGFHSIGSTSLTNTSHWYHIVCEYDGTIMTNNGVDRIKIWVDNVADVVSQGPSATSPVGDIQAGTNPLGIGAYLASTNVSCQPALNFNGGIDDIRFYDRLLNTAEINALFQPCTNPLATITPQGNTTFCQGGFVTLNANSGTGFTYQWYVNGSMLSGFTNSSYTATQSGNYTVVVSDGACSTTSSATTVTVNPNPTVSLGSIGSFVDNNSSTITLTGTPVGGTYSGAVSSSSFNPHTVGLGTKVINYSYTNGFGCSGNASISTIVYDTTGIVCTTYDTITTLISVTDTLIIHAVLTGISPPNNTNTIKVYPNPASDHIYINFGNYSSMNGYTCSITNTLSQQVFYTLINQQQYYIDLNTWTGHGLYFLTIRNAANSVIEVKKIVIQ